MSAALHEICAVACAEAFRGDGEILASPIGVIPTIGARLAKATLAPDLLLTDGVASLAADVYPLGGAPKVVEGWMPYRAIFDLVWSGRRHVMMGASQIDRHGNQNIALIGAFEKPKAQLLGVRGAPGNTINHRTSYWIPAHSTRTLVPAVDFVSGVGYDRARALGPRASRFHDVHRVVTDKGVFDFETPDRTMRLRSDPLRRLGRRCCEEHRLPPHHPRAGRGDARTDRRGAALDPRGHRPDRARKEGAFTLSTPPALHTRICDLFGIRYPIVQTGMGWVAGARLTAATSQAGGSASSPPRP